MQASSVVLSISVFFSGELGQNFTLSWGGATTTTGVYSSKSPGTVIE
jgi:hypothetical protein